MFSSWVPKPLPLHPFGQALGINPSQNVGPIPESKFGSGVRERLLEDGSFGAGTQVNFKASQRRLSSGETNWACVHVSLSCAHTELQVGIWLQSMPLIAFFFLAITVALQSPCIAFIISLSLSFSLSPAHTHTHTGLLSPRLSSAPAPPAPATRTSCYGNGCMATGSEPGVRLLLPLLPLPPLPPPLLWLAHSPARFPPR